MKFTLQDGAEGYESNKVAIEIEPDICNSSVAIKPFGYGDKSHENGHGYPVLIELFEGKLRVIVWDDINEEEPSHVIDLARAAEASRRATG